MATEGLRTYAFVDAEHLRMGLLELGLTTDEVARVSIPTVMRVGLIDVGSKWLGRDLVLGRTFIYAAIAEDMKDAAYVERWLRGNDQEMDTHLRWGRLAGSPGKGGRERRQKAVDVQLAVDAVTGATHGVFDVALFVTGDADFIPVVEAVRESGPLAAVYGFGRSLAKDLAAAADRVGYLREDLTNYRDWVLPERRA